MHQQSNFNKRFLRSLAECVKEFYRPQHHLAPTASGIDAGALKKHYEFAQQLAHMSPTEDFVGDLHRAADADISVGC